MGFDETDFEKPLDAEVQAETEFSKIRNWASKKLEKLGCVFMRKQK